MCLSKVLGVVVLALGAPLAEAVTILSTQGDFVHDDDMQVFSFTLSTMSDVHIYTLSYAGSQAAPNGTNAAGQTVAPGGFAPVLSLFAESSGARLATSAPATIPGSCTYCAIDPATGAQWDADIKIELDPGTYVLVLTEDDNLPLGDLLSDGFLQAGNGDFTGTYFTGQPGSFWDAHPDQRTSHWAVDVLTAPEPAAIWLCGMGMLAILLFRRVPVRQAVRRVFRRSAVLCSHK